MKIIIIGDGKVGYSLAENLSKENHDVTIIDKNSEALKKAEENLDVMCIRGNGVSTKILMMAGVQDTDLLIAVTESDEMNMVCCLTAKKLGVGHTIARIRDPEYASELSLLKRELGLDMVINPEQAAGSEIARLIKFPPATNVEIFAKGRVEMVEINVTNDMAISNMQLKNIANRFSSSVLIGAVQRGDDIIIPDGEFTVREGDTIYIFGQSAKVFDFCRRIGIHVQKIKNVMIMGGGRIAYYLAKYLDEMNIHVKIIEIDHERCRELTELLPHALIICGDGSDETLLKSENFSEMGAFVAVTGRDEDNIIAALLAKQFGIGKVIAKINRMNHSDIIKSMGIDNVVSPKLITTNYILRFVRGLQNAMGNHVNALYRIVEDKAEAIELTAGNSSKYIDIPLKNLNVKKGILIAAIVRKNEIIIPNGNDVIKPGDNVILITKDYKITDLENIIDVVKKHELWNDF
jgi:trk system potassium uptake protein TrkA